ncbi:hypothetical protein [Pseudidiomarina woesei]|uniref:Uncharacterized protein n=1 Tax=Pseudidiomarina woesei TaxID=1381080 RepID=A0A0K6GY32_9GAMM|nr:hypothetical protein [Pseudidiomarina woesei]CUA83626.1 hypothetical protein Ga0061064_0704 [Pseudidiomarina woesei]
MIKQLEKSLTIAVISSLLLLQPVPLSAQEQTHSERLGQILQQRADSHLAADFNYHRLEIITLLGELRAEDVRLSTRVTELDQGLNQVLRADSIVVKGDWLSAAKNNLVVDEVIAKDAQLTVAYYGKGQSNLHALYDAAVAKKSFQRASSPLIWQVKKSRLENVVLNLFDQGEPILSVRLASLELPEMHADDTANDYISRVLWPVLEQVIRQAMFGNSDAVVDIGRLTQFIKREL